MGRAERKLQSSHEVKGHEVLILGHVCPDIGTEIAIIILF